MQNILANRSSASFSGVVLLWITAFLFIGLILSYLYLHEVYKGHPYFWLKNNGLFAEVVYWSLFGALSHVFISINTAASTNSKLPFSKIFFLFAQIITAPLFAVILFTALFYLNEQETFDKSFILLSFIAGLLSGHVLILFQAFFRHSEKEPAIATSFAEENIAANEYVEEQYGLKPYSVVIITLKLDDAGLFFDEKKEISQAGFSTASVSVQKNGSGDIINTVKIGSGKEVTFVADALEQGRYIVRAMQSLRLADNSVLNLFGEQEIIINDEEVSVLLPVRKLKN